MRIPLLIIVSSVTVLLATIAGAQVIAEVVKEDLNEKILENRMETREGFLSKMADDGYKDTAIIHQVGAVIFEWEAVKLDRIYRGTSKCDSECYKLYEIEVR